MYSFFVDQIKKLVQHFGLIGVKKVLNKLIFILSTCSKYAISRYFTVIIGVSKKIKMSRIPDSNRGPIHYE